MMIPAAAFLFFNSLYLMLRVSPASGSFPRPLSAEEEREALEKCAAGDLQARNTLIEHNLRLVAHIVKKYNLPERDADDFISIGTIGLIKAIDTFNPGKNIRLATYASRCIDNAILSQMRLWLQTSPPEQKRTKMACSGTGFRKYLYPLFHFGRLCEVCTHVYP